MDVSGAGLLIIDKDPGMTSHDVVGRCRKILRTRKIGHAGTLDPMATGVLVLGVERATKMLGLLALTTKSYTATIRLGQATTTDDAEGEVLSEASATHLTDDAIAAEVMALTGDIQQIPATVSAIKIDGQRAYALHRAGQDVQLPARPVTVSRFDVLARRAAGDWVDLDVSVDCSSGTYIRALARDLGAALGVGGHLTALRRTAVGPFTLKHACTLDQLADEPRLSMDIDTAALTCFPARHITPAEADSLRHGRWLEPLGHHGVHAAVDPDRKVIALLEERGKRAAPVFVVRPA
ncbi:tRNA pseudouridine(55) synthase TruB [Skermania sp. ID1734]|uniref:tRNA pseudouridine(55) synthase TruB n=1 Tax=Skermania sp. ID1734 TaxID=2597516 RepID=UPI00117F32F7|nr:tRNA pseudouridine(55) synthase TruB [Skermania sp. ID1734]TSD96101.1 tRNA pseudouridine(55) synthase TruB [Skermania sp. ID1734]